MVNQAKDYSKEIKALEDKIKQETK